MGSRSRDRPARGGCAIITGPCFLYFCGLLSGRSVKSLLRILAAAVLLAAVGLWVARGANRGWTKTNIRHETPDPVTGLTGISYEKGFVPGIDFLGGAALAAGVMAGGSLLVKKKI